MILRPLLLSLAMAGLAACTGSTDPATGTVLDNFGNLASGEFDRQLDSKRAEASAIINENERRRDTIGQLDRQRSANASTLASLRGQAASIQSEITSARRAAAAAGNASRVAQLDALSGQASAVTADLDGGGDASVASQELSSIRAAVRALSG